MLSCFVLLICLNVWYANSPPLLPPSAKGNNQFGESGTVALVDALKEVKPQGLKYIALVKHISS